MSQYFNPLFGGISLHIQKIESQLKKCENQLSELKARERELSARHPRGLMLSDLNTLHNSFLELQRKVRYVLPYVYTNINCQTVKYFIRMCMSNIIYCYIVIFDCWSNMSDWVTGNCFKHTAFDQLTHCLLSIKCNKITD